MDCLWERGVCQLGTTVIGKWITTEMEIKCVCGGVCVRAYRGLCKGELSEWQWGRSTIKKEERDKAEEQKSKARDEPWGKERHGKARQLSECKQELEPGSGEEDDSFEKKGG